MGGEKKKEWREKWEKEKYGSIGSRKNDWGHIFLFPSCHFSIEVVVVCCYYFEHLYIKQFVSYV